MPVTESSAESSEARPLAGGRAPCPARGPEAPVNDSNGVGQRKMAAGIRIEKNKPVIAVPPGLYQGEDRVPSPGHLLPPASRTATGQVAKEFQPSVFSQIIAQHWSKPAG